MIAPAPDGTVTAVAAGMVTAPLLVTIPASARPVRIPPPSVIDVLARILPTIVLVATDVKELPTIHTTFAACAPFTSRRDAPLSSVTVEPALNTKIAFGFP